MKALGNLLQTIGGILMVVTYIPNIKMLLENKSADNQSVGFYLLLTISLCMFTINGLIIGSTSVFLSQLANTLLAGTCLFLILYYKHK